MGKRIFVGSPTPESLKKQLDQWVKNQVQTSSLTHSSREIRWIDPENWHWTFAFLGEVEEEVVLKIHEVLEGIVPKLAQVESVFLKGLGAFPHQHCPKVLWAGCDPETQVQLKKIALTIRSELEHFGFKEEKHFHPHLTLARLKSMSSQHFHFLKAFIKQGRELCLGPDSLRKVILYESRRHSHGSVYTPLYEYELGG